MELALKVWLESYGSLTRITTWFDLNHERVFHFGIQFGKYDPSNRLTWIESLESSHDSNQTRKIMILSSRFKWLSHLIRIIIFAFDSNQIFIFLYLSSLSLAHIKSKTNSLKVNIFLNIWKTLSVLSIAQIFSLKLTLKKKIILLIYLLWISFVWDFFWKNSSSTSIQKHHYWVFLNSKRACKL